MSPPISPGWGWTWSRLASRSAWWSWWSSPSCGSVQPERPGRLWVRRITGGAPSARNLRRRPTGTASHQGAAHRRGTARTGSALPPRPQAAVTAGVTAGRVLAGLPCSSRRTCTHRAACSTCPGMAARPGRQEANPSRKSCGPPDRRRPKDPQAPRERRSAGGARTGRRPAGPEPRRRVLVTSPG